MPSRPIDTGWDFGSVIELIGSDNDDIGSPALRPTVRPITSVLQDGGVRLGSFSKLYQNLGYSDSASAPLPALDPDSELSNSDEPLFPSLTPESTQPSAQQSNTINVLSIDLTGLSKKQRKKARKRAEQEQEERARQRASQALRSTKKILGEENRQRVVEERDQTATHGPDTPHQKQLEDSTVATNPVDDFIKTPSKPSRVPLRPAVNADVRPATPNTVVKPKTPGASRTQPKEPKTPNNSKPTILKRPSTAQPVTPVAKQAPVDPVTAPQLSRAFTFEEPASLPYPQRPEYVSAVHSGLVPRTVRPTTVSRSPQPNVAQTHLTPTPYSTQSVRAATPATRPRITIRSQVDRHYHLFNRLLDTFPNDRRWLVAPMQLLKEESSVQGLHVFVDASNIMIGLKDMLRKHGMHHNAYDISFDSLALLMERRRPVAKRFFAGSHREANPLPHLKKLVETSKAVGYDSVMQEQVFIARADSDKKKFFNDVKTMGWNKATLKHSGSGSGSDSETGPPAPQTPSAPKWVEQGVDEILHLKMCQSMLDAEVPSTMVLATGDGAVAEMSDGFLAHVERALKKGWKVELISWGQQINGGYRKRQFRAKWADKFTIIELDEFLEDLIDTP